MSGARVRVAACETRSSSAGEFVLELPVAPTRLVRIDVSHPSFATDSAFWNPGSEITIVLVRRETVYVVVRDRTDQRPVASCQIRLRSEDLASFVDLATTDVNGIAELGLPSGWCELEVHHPDYAISRIRRHRLTSPERVDFELEPNRFVNVLVVRPDGVAIGAPRFWIEDPDRHRTIRRSQPVVVGGREVQRVQVGVFGRLWVGADGFVTTMPRALTATDDSFVTIVLKPARRVFGRVSLDGNPVSMGLHVVLPFSSARADPGLKDVAFRSNADGRFELDGIPALTDLELVPSLPDLLPISVPFGISDDAPVLDLGTLEFRTATAEKRRGRVVDADERPVAGAWVWFEWGPVACSDADGEFLVLPRESAFRIAHPGYREVEAIPPPDPTEPWIIQLERGVSMRVRVVDDFDQPVPFARVDASSVGGEDDDDQPRHGRADASGEFVFWGLESASFYALYASAPGYREPNEGKNCPHPGPQVEIIRLLRQ